MLPLAIVAVLALEDLLARPCSRILGLARTAARRRVTLAALLLVTGATTFAATTWVLQDQAVTDDENVYLFQTRILAAGHLTLPSLSDEEPLRERIFEDNIFLVNNGKIFGQYPFGHSLALLPGYLLGWPHLMPLLFAVFSVLGLYLLTARLYGPPWALLAAFFLAVSPAFLATSATLLAHTSTLCFLIWFFYFAHRTWKERSWLNAVPTGLFFLLAFHMRSATTLLAAGPIGVALAVALLRDYRRQWPKIVVLGLLVVAAAALTLYFNYQANGDLFRTNYHAAWGEGKTPFKHPFGFGKGAWHLVHSPTQGLWNLWDNLLRLNWWLLGWPISLMFVFAWVLRRDKTALEWLFDRRADVLRLLFLLLARRVRHRPGPVLRTRGRADSVDDQRPAHGPAAAADVDAASRRRTTPHPVRDFLDAGGLGDVSSIPGAQPVPRVGSGRPTHARARRGRRAAQRRHLHQLLLEKHARQKFSG
jgi:hypothetical protein